MTETTCTPAFYDWLTVVAPSGGLNSWLRHFLKGQDTRYTHSAYHRSRAVEYYPSGIRHYFTPDSTLDGSILVADGNALANIRHDNDNDFCSKVVAVLARSSHHFSRVDIALDVMDDGYLARLIARDVINGKMSFGRRKARVVMGEGTDGGTTVYVGSRTSPKMMRLYDKSSESKGKIKSTRIEFELKSEASAEVSRIIALYNGWTKTSLLFTGLLNEFADWERYPDIMNLCWGDVTTINIPDRERLLDTKDWLRRQVLPTFVRDPMGNGGELWQWFKELVETGGERSDP